MGAMNKRELAKAVAVQADVELKTVITVIDGFTDVVTAVVSKGEPVSIPGFAKFVKVNVRRVWVATPPPAKPSASRPPRRRASRR